MPFSDRYREAGLKRNPFVARASVDEPSPSFVDRGIPAPPPPGSRTLVQVVGDSGVGKSAHLNYWRTLTPGPFHYIERLPYRARWQRPPTGAIVYGDEIDRMPRVLRRQWFRSLASANATLVIGTHTDLRLSGEATGFNVLTHQLMAFDEGALHTFLNAQLAGAAITPGHFRFSGEEVSAIFSRSDGNAGHAEVLAHRALAEAVRTLGSQKRPT